MANIVFVEDIIESARERVLTMASYARMVFLERLKTDEGSR
jgi:hypothetical protein